MVLSKIKFDGEIKMEKEDIFELVDLTEEFFNTVWYVEQLRSTGMGGAGYILMITEANEEYLLGIEGYDEYEPEKTVALLLQYDQYDKNEMRKRYRAEDYGWTHCSDFATDILIRNDLYAKLNQVYYETEQRELKHEDCYRLLKSVLKLENGMPRKVYKKTWENLEKEEQMWKKREQESAKRQISAEDMEWKPLYANNIISNPIMGYYAFLFKKEEDGSISGYKWTVVYQTEESETGFPKSPVAIEAYNLYFKEYRNVVGILGYREPGYTNCQCYVQSTIRDGVHSYGRFVRSYKTLELAKSAALSWNGHIGWGNVDKSNFIRVSMDEKTIVALKREFEAKMPKDFVVEKDITFGKLRSYLSRIDRLSICMEETLSYENFVSLQDIPESYDSYYVYGIGMIDSEFYKIGKGEYAASGERKDLVLLKCIEVMLATEPKSALIKREDEEEG